jgi:DNA-binding NarL/FixJ family response regulator
MDSRAQRPGVTEVVALLGQELANRQIADRLVASERTAKRRVETWIAAASAAGRQRAECDKR